MKRLTPELAAIVALAVLGLGVGMVAGVGWALIVVSALVLAYIVLPDQNGGAA